MHASVHVQGFLFRKGEGKITPRDNFGRGRGAGGGHIEG